MAYARWLIRWRWPLLVVGCVGWIGAAVISLGLQFNYSFWTLFGSDDPEVLTLIEYQDAWGEDSALTFVLLRSESGDVTTFENLKLLRSLEEQLETLDNVAEVRSMLSTTTVRGHEDDIIIASLGDAFELSDPALAEAALANPLISGVLLAPNRRSTLVSVEIAPGLQDASKRNPIVASIEAIARRHTENTDLRSYLTGIPVAQRIYTHNMIKDLEKFTVMSVALLALILAVLFRSVVGLLLPLGVVGAATTLTTATMVLTGESINMLNSSITTLILVIGIADGVHLLSHYRRRLVAGDSVNDAIAHTMSELGWACLLTSATTAVGFASLMVARIGTVNHFGLYAGIGVLYAYFGNMTLVPVGLAIFKPRLGANSQSPSADRLQSALLKISRFTQTRPWWPLASGAALAVTALVGMSMVQVESRMFEEISDDDPVVIAHRKLEEDLPGITSYALDIITTPGRAAHPQTLATLDDMARMAEAHPAIDRAMGVTDLLKEMHSAAHGGASEMRKLPQNSALIQQYLLLADGDATERVINADQSRTRVWMRGPEVTTSVWEDLRAQLERRSQELAPHGKLVVTGASSMAQRALDSIIRDVMLSLLGASLIILFMMIVLFRSITMGLVSMIPNLLPLLLTVGAMGFLNINLRTSTVVIFSISLGLAVDDTIHFLVRYARERRKGLTLSDAVEETFRVAGRPIVYTSLLLIGGFWILLFSAFNATRDVGFLGGITLASAILADLWVLPALLKVLPQRTERS